jgi:hypothetical protein
MEAMLVLGTGRTPSNWFDVLRECELIVRTEPVAKLQDHRHAG